MYGRSTAIKLEKAGVLEYMYIHYLQSLRPDLHMKNGKVWLVRLHYLLVKLIKLSPTNISGEISKVYSLAKNIRSQNIVHVRSP